MTTTTGTTNPTTYVHVAELAAHGWRMHCVPADHAGDAEPWETHVGEQCAPSVWLEVPHPRHASASSIRQEGFPLYAITSQGRVARVGRTTKRATTVVAPADTTGFLVVYRTNGGHTQLHWYGLDWELTRVVRADDLTVRTLLQTLQQVGIDPDSAYRLLADVYRDKAAQ